MSSNRIKILLSALALLPLAGCLPTHRPYVDRTSTAHLQDATLDQLVESINTSAAQLQSVNATVDIDASVLERKKSSIKEYPQARGFVLVRKPGMMHMKVLVPVMQNTAIDMVSNGRNFQLSVPSKNQFLIGSNQIGKRSPEPLMNLRPQHVLDAILLQPVDSAAGEIAVMEDGVEMVKDPKTHKDATQADYVVTVLAPDSKGYHISRKIFFSRTDLRPRQQIIYNLKGQLMTIASYENYADHAGTMFPETIGIQRPVEDFTIKLSVVRLSLNQQLTDDQFDLPQPPGSKLINVDEEKQDSAENQAALRDNTVKKP